MFEMVVDNPDGYMVNRYSIHQWVWKKFQGLTSESRQPFTFSGLGADGGKLVVRSMHPFNGGSAVAFNKPVGSVFNLSIDLALFTQVSGREKMVRDRASKIEQLKKQIAKIGLELLDEDAVEMAEFSCNAVKSEGSMLRHFTRFYMCPVKVVDANAFRTGYFDGVPGKHGKRMFGLGMPRIYNINSFTTQNT